MLIHHALLLFGAAFLGGLLNSVAGGGGFLCFPALLFTGVPPINANATNTVALWPGTVAATAAYRGSLLSTRGLILPLTLTGIAGALLGAVVLLKTPQSTFLRLIPWLMLVATLLFAFSGRISAWLRARTTHTSRHAMAGAALFQLIIAVYIGYFGAGSGILMLAMFALLGVENIHAMNGLKTYLASVCNAVAMATFIIAKAIFWPQAILMVIGATIGGYGGAYFAQKVRPDLVRQFVVLVGTGMTLYFFIR